MKIIINDKKILSAVSYHKIESYLSGKGWHIKDQLKNKANFWKLNDKVILVPTLELLEDYSSRIYDVINELSQIENRSQIEIYRDINSSLMDVVRLKAKSPEYIDGTIPIKSGIDLLQGSERVFNYSAWSLIDTKPYYIGKPPEQVTDLMNSVKMGQSEHGSYVVTLNIPLEGIEQKKFNNFQTPTSPYARLVSEKASEAMSNLRDAARIYAKELKPEIFDEIIQHGVNANICDAVVLLSNVSGYEDINMDITPCSEYVSNFNTNIIIPTTSAAAIKEASIYLQNKDVNNEAYIEGEVIKLDKDNKFHAVILTTSLGRALRLHVDLDEGQHKIAIQSYHDEMTIKAAGRIKKRGKLTYLDRISIFELK